WAIDRDHGCVVTPLDAVGSCRRFGKMPSPRKSHPILIWALLYGGLLLVLGNGMGWVTLLWSVLVGAGGLHRRIWNEPSPEVSDLDGRTAAARDGSP
ncbi:hypothetical protein ACLOJK_004747, partial [Asimina triloba]